MPFQCESVWLKKELFHQSGLVLQLYIFNS